MLMMIEVKAWSKSLGRGLLVQLIKGGGSGDRVSVVGARG